ncbi:MAG: DUF3536 domain-containing protein [Elusimicrobia bacterium]|nr:DUF3536 domain-containing protein [Elusimicrobiota bacterium]
MKNKYLCIHGHFYQPPRESPWLDEVEEEPSAYPYHDWNERVFHECYGPNTASAVLGAGGAAAELVDNYRWISFNFGPTLLSWLERHQPRAYRAILEADRASADERGGHGNAMAQAYNHAILPLATRRDKVTQVRWGLSDFKHRFGRDAEGLWLAECACDDETLEVLAAEGVRFTVLSPHQAKRVRRAGGSDGDCPKGLSGSEGSGWRDVNASSLETRHAYRWRSKERPGRHVDIFFYDPQLAQSVAFDGLLHDGAKFAKRLFEPFSTGDAAQLVQVATDGESYGHHHKFGNMALSFALKRLREDTPVRLTNYAEFLSLFPPPMEAEIHQPSSWSCAHGVRRWTDDCGCSTGGQSGWHQRWRKPLREALDWLAGEADRLYETKARELFRDPWAARDGYIHRLLGERVAATHRFLSAHEARHLKPEEAELALRLGELQRQRLLMYTSCGWFFSEVSGVEGVQILKYAARVVELAAGLGEDLSAGFEARLAKAPSNDPAYDDAAAAYRKLVLPLRVDLARAAAHFAVLDHFEGAPTAAPHYAYEVKRHAVRRVEGRGKRLSFSYLQLRHFPTFDHRPFAVVVRHRGRIDVDCWVLPATPAEALRFERGLSEAFPALEDPDFRALAERDTGALYFSLDALFTDERRKLVASLIPGGTPEQQQLAQRWRRTGRRLLAEPEGLSEALRELGSAAEAGLSADRLPDASAVRRRIHEAFWSYADSGEPGAAELEGLLRSARSAGLSLDVWELQSAAAKRRGPDDDASRAVESLWKALNLAPALTGAATW